MEVNQAGLSEAVQVLVLALEGCGTSPSPHIRGRSAQTSSVAFWFRISGHDSTKNQTKTNQQRNMNFKGKHQHTETHTLWIHFGPFFSLTSVVRTSETGHGACSCTTPPGPGGTQPRSPDSKERFVRTRRCKRVLKHQVDDWFTGNQHETTAFTTKTNAERNPCHCRNPIYMDQRRWVFQSLTSLRKTVTGCAFSVPGRSMLRLRGGRVKQTINIYIYKYKA